MAVLHGRGEAVDEVLHCAASAADPLPVCVSAEGPLVPVRAQERPEDYEHRKSEAAGGTA
eukprot:319263-Prymnesium_polylepis.2